MTFKPCSKRDKLMKFSREGDKTTVNVCSEKTAPDFQKEVTPEACESCSVRQFVMKAEKQKKAKPPKFSELFPATYDLHVHQDKTWLPCSMRQAAYVKTCCGGQSRVIRCINAACKDFDHEVNKETCRQCQDRVSV